MKIVVIGGRGLIGSRVAAALGAQGHDVTAQSRRSGVDAFTGEGLADAVAGADVLVDVADSPLFDDEPVMRFFTTTTRNLLAAEREAGVGHHVALSVVGAQAMPDSGYNSAKAAQENLIKDSGLPYSIVRATPFYEFAVSLADSATEGDVVRLPHALFRPIAADDVATAVARAAVERPVNGVIEIVGPESIGMDDFVRTGLAAHGDQRRVVTDPEALYFGAKIDDQTLAPGESATIFATRFSDWIDAHVHRNYLTDGCLPSLRR
ncbi:SDR family oxidoreductase [Mycolicibacterium goodii]|uniref:NAD(P)H-binding protein n=1 Tax=Mycolicibacterium goodii TaxID=134601 RepID=A0ABS6HV83_MYCGD|nr:NAD(P)H-binding protein [Mycolicibacterium goodii]MBU8813685.1 NAD(P)H-binding protein [Mycolicibacterium goodii]MBU8820175.1 NAD(P)H-binding protein [Mycolicibacterium goodii]MBU8826579.1 NAD(P)H-binding protein [Mycolicibacterium goodii]MBU8840051.1 NAD(P)H-binding protein [Mycolicibacterium goodii]PJK20544.1 LysR family transcriptional regulator [Mycolicibacterium goodii]